MMGDAPNAEPVENGDSRVFRRSDLPAAAGRDFLLKEMDLLQSLFNKYEEWIFRSRTGLVLGIGALLSVELAKPQPGVAEAAVVLPIISWLIEAGIRWESWQPYVQRHYAIRHFLNDPDQDSSISLYDLKNTLMPMPPGHRAQKFRRCFLNTSMVWFYGVIWLLAFTLFDPLRFNLF
jgi:hypothetical protein